MILSHGDFWSGYWRDEEFPLDLATIKSMPRASFLDIKHKQLERISTSISELEQYLLLTPNDMRVIKRLDELREILSYIEENY
jgi:hypothetical protein